jgi:hypothetical protein
VGTRCRREYVEDVILIGIDISCLASRQSTDCSSI